jgi:hypothetical protein
MRKAMGVLKMLAQNDMERELYEGRLKAKRDQQTLETMRDQWQRQAVEAQRQAVESQRQAVESQQQYAEAAGQLETLTREREEARGEIKRELAERIRLCQRLLKKNVSNTEDLAGRDLGDLRRLADSLEQELNRKGDGSRLQQGLRGRSLSLGVPAGGSSTRAPVGQ